MSEERRKQIEKAYASFLEKMIYQQDAYGNLKVKDNQFFYEFKAGAEWADKNPDPEKEALLKKLIAQIEEFTKIASSLIKTEGGTQ